METDMTESALALNLPQWRQRFNGNSKKAAGDIMASSGTNSPAVNEQKQPHAQVAKDVALTTRVLLVCNIAD
jgi:hypothetical protein